MVTQRLKTIAHVIAGQSPSSDDVKPLDEGVPFIQGNAEFGSLHPTPKWECNSATKFAEPGDILISVRAPVGEVNIADSKIGIGRGLAAIRPKDISLSKWLYFALMSNKEYLNSIATGSTFTAVTTNNIGNIRLTIPENPQDIADQLDRELAKIDEFIADVTKLQKLIEEREIAELEKNLIESATEFVELRRFKPRCISGTSVNAAPWQADDSGFGVLKTGVVSKGYFDPTQNKAVLEESEISRLSTPVKANTIIVNRANSPELVGSAAFVEKDFPNLFLSDKLWQIDFEGANNTHMATVMQTMFFKEQVRQRCVGASSSMQNLSYHDFLSLKVPIISETRINSSNTKLLQINNNLVNLLLERKNILVGQSVEGIQQ